MSSRPIGIFDSGIGGLTVALSVMQTLPNEQIIYFGDTANLPYGDKTVEEIRGYCLKICDFLLTQNCKVILIACNSASSAAYEQIKEYVGTRAEVISVIDPIVEYINSHHKDKKIGLIGTKQTVSSNIYKEKLLGLNAYLNFKALATPLLVPAIEAEIDNHEIITQIIHTYLSDSSLDDIEILILGCTHYPLIKSYIENFYKALGKEVVLLDSAESVAEALKQYLTSLDLLTAERISISNHFYISKMTSSFLKTAQHLFNCPIQLTELPL